MIAFDSSLRERRILLVDGNPQHRSKLTEYLRAHGHNVSEFSDRIELPPQLEGSLAVVVDHDKDVHDIESIQEYNSALAHIVMITDDWSKPTDRRGDVRTLLWLRSRPLECEELERLLDTWEGRWGKA